MTTSRDSDRPISAQRLDEDEPNEALRASMDDLKDAPVRETNWDAVDEALFARIGKQPAAAKTNNVVWLAVAATLAADRSKPMVEYFLPNSTAKGRPTYPRPTTASVAFNAILSIRLLAPSDVLRARRLSTILLARALSWPAHIPLRSLSALSRIVLALAFLLNASSSFFAPALSPVLSNAVA